MSGKAVPFRAALGYSRRNRSGDFDAALLWLDGEPEAHRSSGGAAAKSPAETPLKTFSATRSNQITTRRRFSPLRSLDEMRRSFKGRNLKRFIVVNVDNAAEDLSMGVNFCIRGIGDG